MAVLVDAHTVRTQAMNVLHAYGVPAPAAYIVVQSLLEASLRGYDALGIARLPSYCAALRSGEINPQGMPEVVDETELTIWVDGHGGFGHVATAFAMGNVIRKAQEYGMATASIFNCSSTDLMQNYAEMATERGLIGIACHGSTWSPDVFDDDDDDDDMNDSPTSLNVKENVGSRWAVALPTDVLMAVVLDDSPFFHRNVISPEAVLGILSLVMGALLTEVIMKKQEQDNTGAVDAGIFVSAIDIDIAEFGSPDVLPPSIRDMREEFKMILPVNDMGTPLLPGEAAFAMREQRMVVGIPLDDAVWAELLSLS